jgi:tetraacyldisaccharide 4'-kinase
VIGVGGATLGGSGKSNTAVAIAQVLAARGARVALVGHAYRAQPGRARWVKLDDAVAAVGDEALAAARELTLCGVRVAVAPVRQAALELAATAADCVVVDGLLQAGPTRLFRSLLVLDGERPWGNGHCPPAGDLRAPPADLLRAADAVLLTGPHAQTRTTQDSDALARLETLAHPPTAAQRVLSGSAGSLERSHEREPQKPVHRVTTVVDLARTLVENGMSVDELRAQRTGLLLAIARPERVLRSLAELGVVPSVTWLYGDHQAPSAAELERRAAQLGRAGPRLWLTTAKCATKLPAQIAGSPVLALAHTCELSPELISWLSSDCASLPFPARGAVVDCAPCELPAEN